MLLLLAALGGCTLLKEKEGPPDDPALALAGAKLTPEQAKELTSRAASNWFYGQGLGRTALTVGTILAFPPFGLLVAGNAALDLSGYEPITVSGILPEEEGRAWSEGYDAVTSLPGHMTSSLAGEEFKTDERAREEMRSFIAAVSGETEGEAMKARLKDSSAGAE